MTRVGRALLGFAAFWWDFIVGEDRGVAVCVVAALALTAALSAGGMPAWWLLPVAVLSTLAVSVRRRVEQSRRR